MKKILAALLLGMILYGLSTLYFTLDQARLIGVVTFLVTLWSNEGLELGTVSFLPLLLFPSLGIVDFDHVAPNYAKPIIFLFIGGFLLAIGLQKTQLHTIIAHKVLSIFPSTVTGIIYALAITSALLSAILSNTTTTILLVPIALFLTLDDRIRLRFVLAIAYGATIGGILTPIGTAPNLILLQFLTENHLGDIAFFQWIRKIFPLAVFMLSFMPWLLARGVSSRTITLPEVENKSLDSDQKKMLIILGGLIILLFVNSPMKPFYSGLGLDEKMLLLGAGVLLFLPKIGILEWKDTKEVPYSIVFLFGASFSIAAAFTSTELGEALARPISSFSALPWIVLLFIVPLFVSFATEVTSNTALISIVLPVFFTFTQMAHLESLPLLMVATIASSYAFMLPIATPPNAIAMATGVVRVKDMMRFGVILNLVGIVALGLVANFIW